MTTPAQPAAAADQPFADSVLEVVQEGADDQLRRGRRKHREAVGVGKREAFQRGVGGQILQKVIVVKDGQAARVRTAARKRSFSMMFASGQPFGDLLGRMPSGIVTSASSKRAVCRLRRPQAWSSCRPA